MPVSPLPLLIPALLLGVPVVLLLIRGRRVFARAGAVSALLVMLLLLWVYVPGWVLIIRANRGDPEAMYDLARWTEKHHEQIGDFILWPFDADVLGGYAWLEKAAGLDYPPAVYAVGVRLKHGQHVPPREGGNEPQLERGQALIDKALWLGYQPTIKEQAFYWQQYRK